MMMRVGVVSSRSDVYVMLFSVVVVVDFLLLFSMV